MRSGSNFNVPPGVNISGYPRPRVDRVTHRRITVDTSLGPREATEVMIVGEHFAIRAVEPEVMVNALPLVRFRIADNTRSITGYLFEPLQHIWHVAVDYGLGARGEWAPARGGTISALIGAAGAAAVLLIFEFGRRFGRRERDKDSN